MAEAGAAASIDGTVADDVRRRLALVLDVDDLVEAIRLGQSLRPWFGVAKVGLELFSAAGPDAIGALRDLGYQVFLDLKLFDIPTTVNRACRVLGALGVEYLTLHATGGVDMLRAGVEGLTDGAERAGLPSAHGVGGDGADQRRLRPAPHRAQPGPGGRRGRLRRADAGRRGPPDRPRAGPAPASGWCPASAWPVAPRHDQARAATPQEAVANGADLLVIGRAVTQAEDPVGGGCGRRRGAV